ncbi:hypothetical protein ACF065_34640 [Streptomyces sp. NPDC015232]|uniref:hypothetical protein n=1 Tax=unclassified Streptomyces TaxID=2593676 RepID=UPI0037009A7A
MSGVISVAPAGYVHRRVDCTLAQTCPHHLKLELQLIAHSRMFDDIQAEDDRRPLLGAWEDGVLQCPFPLRPVSIDASRIDGTGRIRQGFHVCRR